MDSHKNLAYSTVDTAPSPAVSGTTITVEAGTGSRFPAANFPVTICAAGEIPLETNAEIAYCTSRTGDVLTITRAQEGTSARSILAGDQIFAAITAKSLTDIEAAIPSVAGLLSAVNVSAGAASANLSALTFSNASGVSFGLAGSVITATVNTNYQAPGAYLTTAALSQDSSKYAGTNGAITGGSITVNTAGVSVNLPAYLTTARASTDAVGLNTALTANGVAWTVNSSGISLNVPAFLTTAALSNHSHGNPQLNLTNLTGTTASNSAGFTLSLSAAAPGAGGFQSAGFSTQGNTIGNTGFASQSLQLVGGNNITLSGSTGAGGLTLTISGANAGGAQTGISSMIVSDATYTSGMVSFSNAGNVTISSSVNGATQYIRLSGNAAQTNQSAIKGFGVSNTGQTAGNTGISSGIDWVLAGSGSITLSQSTAVGGPNTVWVQHPAWLTTAAQSNAVVQSINGSTGTFSFNTGSSLSSSRVGNAITFGLASDITTALQSTGAYLTTAAQSNQVVQSINGSTGTFSFNTGSSLSSSRVGNAITFGLASDISTALQSAGAYLTTAALSTQTLGFSLSGNVATTNSSRISNGAYALAGGNNVTIQQSNNTVSISVGNYITTARGSTDAIGLNTAQSNVTWTVNSSGLSFDARGYAGTATGATNASVTVNSGGVSVSVGAYITTADLSQNSSKYVQNWKLTGNTSGTTSSAQGTDLWFSGGNSITVSGNSNSIVFSVGNYITTARASTDAIGLNTAQSNVTWTVNSSGLSFDARGYAGTGTSATNASVTLNSNGLAISVAAPGAAAEANWVSLLGANTAGNVTASGSTIGWSGGNGVTLSGTNASQVVISVNTYSTVGTATSGYPVASANSIGTITRWAAEDHRHAGIGAFGISTGNTSGTSGSVQGTYWVAGSNLTVSQITSNNGSHTLMLSGNTPIPIATTVKSVASANSVGTVTRYAAEDHAHAGIGALGISTSGNTAGTTGSVQGTYWVQGGTNITVSQITSNNGSHTLVVSGALNTVGHYEPYSQTNTAGLALVAGSWYFAPFVAPAQISGGRINFLHVNTSTAGIVRDITGGSYVSSSSGGKNQSYTYSKAVALYSQGTGTNSTRLESFWSNSFSFGLSHRVLVSQSGANSSVSVTVSQSISYISEIGSDGAYTLNQFASNNNSAGTNTSIASNALDSVGVSIRNMLSNSLVIPVGFNTTIQPGAYWLAVAWSSTSASATSQTSFAGASALMFSELSQVGISHLELNSLYRNWGSTATTARSGLMPSGVYTAAANMAPPQFVALSSDLASVASQWTPYFNFAARGLTK